MDVKIGKSRMYSYVPYSLAHIWGARTKRDQLVNNRTTTRICSPLSAPPSLNASTPQPELPSHRRLHFSRSLVAAVAVTFLRPLMPRNYLFAYLFIYLSIYLFIRLHFFRPPLSVPLTLPRSPSFWRSVLTTLANGPWEI